MKTFSEFLVESELPKNSITIESAKSIGNAVGVDWDSVDLEQFRRGLEVEFEHIKTVNYDESSVAKIVLDHLKENSKYYDDLDKMENVTEAAPTKIKTTHQPETEVDKTRQKQEREKDSFVDKQAQELELARRADFEKKEAERKRESAQKKAEKLAKEDVNVQFESLLWGTDEATAQYKKDTPGQ